MKILLAVDGSEPSDTAVDQIASRPWPKGSEVKVISVAEPAVSEWGPALVMSGTFYDELERIEEESARAAMTKAAARLESAERDHPRITTFLARGLAKEAILDEAERWGADLIVLGSHGYKGLTRFLLGSVSHAVAAHAKCSVEIVRARSQEPASA